MRTVGTSVTSDHLHVVGHFLESFFSADSEEGADSQALLCFLTMQDILAAGTWRLWVL
jgi:hypothetical protein